MRITELGVNSYADARRAAQDLTGAATARKGYEDLDDYLVPPRDSESGALDVPVVFVDKATGAARYADVIAVLPKLSAMTPIK